MPPVAHSARLVRFLKYQPYNRASRSKVIAALRETGLTEEQAERTIERALEDPNSAVTSGRGGHLTYWGIEIGKTVGLYDAVGRVFSEYFGPRELGLRFAQPVSPLRSPGGGEWTLPDLVVFAHPRRKRTADALKQIHSLEIEQTDGFGVQSVYQAYEQSRGADYAWAFAHLRPRKKLDPRIVASASEQGVGLVTFTKPDAFGSYRLQSAADRRDVTANERRGFLERTNLPDLGHYT